LTLCASHIPQFMHDDPIPTVPPTDCAVCVEEPLVRRTHQFGPDDLTRAIELDMRRTMLHGNMRVGFH
jgi:hypothetical protein